MPPVTHAPSPERFAKAWSRRPAEAESRSEPSEDVADSQSPEATDALERAGQRAALVSKLVGQHGYGSWHAMLAGQKLNS